MEVPDGWMEARKKYRTNGMMDVERGWPHDLVIGWPHSEPHCSSWKLALAEEA